MNFNSGSRLVFIIFAIVIAVLLVLLILAAIQGKKKNKVPVVLKVFTIIFAVISIAGCFVFPLSYYNAIPLDLQYGKYLAYNSSDYLVIHHDSLEYHKNGSSSGDKATYNLSNDVLTITYQNGTQDKYFVEPFGAALVDATTNVRTYYFSGN